MPCRQLKNTSTENFAKAWCTTWWKPWACDSLWLCLTSTPAKENSASAGSCMSQNFGPKIDPLYHHCFYKMIFDADSNVKSVFLDVSATLTSATPWARAIFGRTSCTNELVYQAGALWAKSRLSHLNIFMFGNSHVLWNRRGRMYHVPVRERPTAISGLTRAESKNGWVWVWAVPNTVT